MDHFMKIGFTLVVLAITANYAESWGVLLGGLTAIIVLVVLYQKDIK